MSGAFTLDILLKLHLVHKQGNIQKDQQVRLLYGVQPELSSPGHQGASRASIADISIPANCPWKPGVLVSHAGYIRNMSPGGVARGGGAQMGRPPCPAPVLQLALQNHNLCLRLSGFRCTASQIPVYDTTSHCALQQWLHKPCVHGCSV